MYKLIMLALVILGLTSCSDLNEGSLTGPEASKNETKDSRGLVGRIKNHEFKYGGFVLRGGALSSSQISSLLDKSLVENCKVKIKCKFMLNDNNSTVKLISRGSNSITINSDYSSQKLNSSYVDYDGIRHNNTKNMVYGGISKDEPEGDFYRVVYEVEKIGSKLNIQGTIQKIGSTAINTVSAEMDYNDNKLKQLGYFSSMNFLGGLDGRAEDLWIYNNDSLVALYTFDNDLEDSHGNYPPLTGSSLNMNVAP